MSAGVRLIYYASVCVALLVLRWRKNAPSAEFHLPLGPLFAVLAVAVSLWLFPKFDKPGTWVLAVLAAIVVVNSFWAIRSERRSETQRQPSLN
jgi:amino acid transporter